MIVPDKTHQLILAFVRMVASVLKANLDQQKSIT